MNNTIWWVRRDLRLSDNQALYAAVQSGDQVTPVFIIDPRLTETQPLPQKRIDFLWGGLQALDKSLRARGSRLIVRRGDPLEELAHLVKESKASAVYAEEDFTPFARRRDRAIARELPLHLLPGLTMFFPDSVRKADGNPYTVFTPFSKAWHRTLQGNSRKLLSAPERMATPIEITSLPLPNPVGNVQFPPGEIEALHRLQNFTTGNHAPIYQYADQRDRPDLPGTSTLSPYLRFGMLSARQAVFAAEQAAQLAPDETARQGAQTWLNELIWREFFISILFHFPDVMKESFRPELRQISWRNNEVEFLAWKEGQTGYPIVDAAMRQLAKTGWMHNRARMIVASFLVKDLLINWRWGERWFMQMLVDGDPAANTGGWQWSAGTGTDAAPYFRIFNPVLQGKKFDPQGDYVRQWVPELANLPPKFIHNPWEMPHQLQIQFNVLLGVEYPFPIVDHTLARERTLEAYQHAKVAF
ncbi:MAG: cryptochrome/photolyase family protein [Anaerolineales bacterium]